MTRILSYFDVKLIGPITGTQHYINKTLHGQW
jgi:hypothetical protein